MVADGLPKVFKDKRMIQKVLFLFRALPFAPVRGGGYPRELALGYPPPHTVAPARWQAEKKQNQKAAVGGKKSPAVRRNKNSCLRRPNPTISPSQALPKGREHSFSCLPEKS